PSKRSSRTCVGTSWAAMATPLSNPTDGTHASPDLLRRLREFQAKVRPEVSVAAAPRVRPREVVVSGVHAAIMDRLRLVSTHLADGLQQSMEDLSDQTRLTYVGPAGEAREVLRACIQLLAPDTEVRKQPWFTGV